MIELSFRNKLKNLKDKNDLNIYYYPDFLSKETSDILYKKLHIDIPWQKYQIKVFGKTYDQPRLTSFHSIGNKNYNYSQIGIKNNLMTEDLKSLLNQIHSKTDFRFNSVLLNLYRDGMDSNGWHSDNESELGNDPKIASVTLGEERFFHLKHKKIKNLKYKILLRHGSLLLMGEKSQTEWLHQIPKTKKKIKPRINLTYRYIY
ncbi:MAG: alpha-ketoglutarate-dependent dioxygenase AlkB [Flavobacteriaceae bacterium]|nr:alpha-ketoglutarate-dependent dioxygenase AlkB [Flavobacteriaceae bacterium]